MHDVGDDPDYRFTLANERTYLAWVRTALALMAGGVAVVQFVPSFGLTGARHGLGLTLIALGGVVAGGAFRHWERNERAMRLGQRLPHSPLPRLLGTALAVIAVAAFALVLVEARR